ncbi:DUF1571 domain-containing protein [Paraburkholderia bryophila]|uniref:DUF1571 domain-containing protein n=1 Tax=Burkholderiaceae TaxID=119060 RepID=UPI00068F22C7|nr:DUF1571 domain-containing protein [Burkholderia sp. 9120]
MRGHRRSGSRVKSDHGFIVVVAMCVALLVSLTARAAAADEVQRVAPVACNDEATSGASGGDLAGFACLSAGEQANVIRERIDDGTLGAMPDSRLIALIDAMKPEAIVAYTRVTIGAGSSYEYWMRRRERVNGKWPTQADHMEVYCQDSPQRVYVKWLPDGAHAGQEIIYDETRDPTRFLGHFGGAWHFLSGRFQVDGTFARTQSRHSVRDLGLQFVVHTLEHEEGSFEAEGLSAKPSRVEVETANGKRLLALTWDAPDGPPAHFAPRMTLTFDLHRPQLHSVIAAEASGEPLEEIDFEQIVPHAWTDEAFDPHNPSYDFR